VVSVDIVSSACNKSPLATLKMLGALTEVTLNVIDDAASLLKTATM
jgi:hypothetical protein